ncbi:histidine phosphatase family protein [Aquamicrobium segne]|uniref:Histidine phosphatase family protein n=1 Tax=Aquamicrobium segne TaxID=469547 RepID=A0ABW0GXN2_9HYPH
MSAPIYIVRHGQTDWNAEYRLQGQADIDLNALGRSQATQNGHKLSALIGSDVHAFDFVASPMARTRHTMELMRTAMGLDPAAYRMDERLKELNFGDWQGYTLDELEALHPGTARERAFAKWDFCPPGDGAESYQMLMERVEPVFRKLRGPAVCVTHGGVIRSLFCLVGTVTRQEASALVIRQDRILLWQNGTLEWL